MIVGCLDDAQIKTGWEFPKISKFVLFKSRKPVFQ